MTSPEQSLQLPRGRRRTFEALSAALLGRPRTCLYLAATILVVVVSYVLGKEMMWDTLDYHLYAGFSAAHDRFGQDYFAAGAQSYLNPYVYLPFYLLVRTGLPSLCVASILAAVQSGILWITYELALAVSPADDPRSRMAAGVCAALLALANPILINQLGSSYADVTTAEIVLVGFLLLVQALRSPSAMRIACAGLLVGVASGLKLTNSLHALSACALLPFLPIRWRGKLRYSLAFAVAMAIGFAVVAAPWAIQLERHFGNPFFPLFNGIFRSPQFPTTPMVDNRYVPSSIGAALWRPFALLAPRAFVDDEYAAPDLRYVLLLALVLLAFAFWCWRRTRGAAIATAVTGGAPARRALLGLGCAFLVDWTLWLTASGNGRYFITMACIAAVLAITLAFRLFAARPKALGYLLALLFTIQGLQLALGAGYRVPAAWNAEAWFDMSIPPALASESDLFFTVGEESNSFVAPFLARGSAFVNLEGDYVLGPDGANGAHIQALIHRYANHIRVAVLESELTFAQRGRLPDLAHVDDTLAPFGLRTDDDSCSTIIIHNVRNRWHKVLPDTLPIRIPQLDGQVLRIPVSPDGYLRVCRVVSDPGAATALEQAERVPNLVLDRVEDACPRLFQPQRPLTTIYGDGHTGYRWIRKYPSTNLTTFIDHGLVALVDGARGGRPRYLGRASDWAKSPLPLACGRHGELYYAHLSPSPVAQGGK
jgi:hypothetical protein